jgi:hypothetical protein
MRVDLRGRQVHVPEQGLDVHELGAGPQEPNRVGMPELMRRDLLVDAGPPTFSAIATTKNWFIDTLSSSAHCFAASNKESGILNAYWLSRAVPKKSSKPFGGSGVRGLRRAIQAGSSKSACSPGA